MFKRVSLVAWLLSVVCATPIVHGQEAAKPPALRADKLGTTNRVHAFGSTLLAGQPSAADLAEAKRRGVKTVISLREASEIDWDEPGKVKELGLTFHRLGFRSPKSLTDELFDQALKLLADKKNSPVLLHCASANRVGAIWLAHRVVNDGIAVEAARAEAKTVGLRTLAFEQSALDYVKRRRAAGDKASASPLRDKTPPAAASAPKLRPPQGVAPGVEKPLLIAPRPDNGRNSEGDFIQLEDGRLLLIYSKFIGTGDHAPAELVGRYSSDGGKTWGGDDVQVIARTGDDANLMSVSLLRLTDGRIALFYIQKYNSPAGSKYPYLDNILMRTSSDEGKTWSKPTHVVPKDQPGYRVLNNDRVIQLKSGRLIVPLAVHYLPGWPGFKGSADIVCYWSDDQGKSWQASKSTLKSKLLAQEPGVVELSDGGVLMFCRSRDCQLVSRSDDGGDTWSPLKRSNIAQPTTSPASIERIPKTGHLLLVWNNGNDPRAALKPVGRRPFTAAISKDEGATWQHVRNLGTDPKGWYCYTAIDFVDDHVLLAHCEFPGLNSLQITRVPVGWLYEDKQDIQEK